MAVDTVGACTLGAVGAGEVPLHGRWEWAGRGRLLVPTQAQDTNQARVESRDDEQATTMDGWMHMVSGVRCCCSGREHWKNVYVVMVSRQSRQYWPDWLDSARQDTATLCMAVVIG